MKFLYFIFLFLIVIIPSFSFELGGAYSLDYYNNPIKDSAPSPIQSSFVVFHNLNLSFFNLRSGFGILEASYEVNKAGLLVFNDYYSGINTVEFDVFVSPGLLIPLNSRVSLGLSGTAGVRLPVIFSVDPDGDDAKNAFEWFYSDLHYMFWGGQLFTTISLPIGADTKLFISANYRNFVNRDNQWSIGATTGLLWQLF
ncbi:MAG: hypothetical protein B6229_09490 [Spirochaetaceae bacterium 4572_7]|nr:MAG: hypothetical protein B6229_09490 [Spirochaetaceae bacterium 4572_7]